jgi:LCP family protein required for cell wall assembly
MNDTPRPQRRVASIDGFVARPRVNKFSIPRQSLNRIGVHDDIPGVPPVQPPQGQRKVVPTRPQLSQATPPLTPYKKGPAEPTRSRQSLVQPNAPQLRPDAPTHPLSQKGKKLSRKERKAEKLKNKKPSKHPRLKKILKRGGLVALALVILGAGWFGWTLYHNASKITGNKNPFSLLSVFKPVPLKNHNGRVNVLLAGDSADRTDGAGGDTLTDSIMVLSLDTKTHTGTMVSIPRDLWVEIPGMGHQKINAANTNTGFSAQGYPSGGMGQLEQVITDNLGIPIDYYALINYTAFRDMVNAMGGITVNIQSSDPRGLYDPSRDLNTGGALVKLSNGVQTLNGGQALNLARARGDAYGSYGFPQSDFNRTENQRMMLTAVKNKANTLSVLTNPVTLSKLANAVGNNVKTDMKLNEAESFYALSKDINDSNITSVNINTLIPGQTMLANYTSPQGLSALIPAAGLDVFGDIQAALQKIFSNDPVVKEGARIVVLNGGNLIGIAGQESKILQSKNMNVIATADAPSIYQKTTIVDKSGGKMPNTKSALVKLFGNNVTTSDPAATNYNADFVVILGVNQQAPSSSSGSN